MDCFGPFARTGSLVQLEHMHNRFAGLELRWGGEAMIVLARVGNAGMPSYDLDVGTR